MREDDNPGYGAIDPIAAQNPFGIADFGSAPDLADAFLGPWLRAAKTSMGAAKLPLRSAATLCWVALQTVLTTAIPIYGYNYASVFKKQDEDLKKIKDSYAGDKAKTIEALSSGDAGLVAFMISPATAMAAAVASGLPGAGKSVAEFLSAGTAGGTDKLYDVISSALEKTGRTAIGDDVDAEEKGKRKSPSDILNNSYSRKGKLRLFEDDKSSTDKFDQIFKKHPELIEQIIKQNPKLSQEVADMSKKATAVHENSMKELEGIIQSSKNVNLDNIEKFVNQAKAKYKKMDIPGMKEPNFAELEKSIQDAKKAAAAEKKKGTEEEKEKKGPVSDPRKIFAKFPSAVSDLYKKALKTRMDGIPKHLRDTKVYKDLKALAGKLGA